MPPHYSHTLKVSHNGQTSAASRIRTKALHRWAAEQALCLAFPSASISLWGEKREGWRGTGEPGVMVTKGTQCCVDLPNVMVTKGKQCCVSAEWIINTGKQWANIFKRILHCYKWLLNLQKIPANKVAHKMLWICCEVLYGRIISVS